MSRFYVTYAIGVDQETEARAIANAVAVEQTIEFPPELVTDDFIAGQIQGRLESLTAAQGHFLARISYDELTTAW